MEKFRQLMEKFGLLLEKFGLLLVMLNRFVRIMCFFNDSK